MAEKFQVPQAAIDDQELSRAWTLVAQIGELTPSQVTDAPETYDPVQIQTLVDRIAELETELKNAIVLRDA